MLSYKYFRFFPAWFIMSAIDSVEMKYACLRSMKVILKTQLRLKINNPNKKQLYNQHIH